jgi:hypothetical protein
MVVEDNEQIAIENRSAFVYRGKVRKKHLGLETLEDGICGWVCCTREIAALQELLVFETKFLNLPGQHLNQIQRFSDQDY